MNPRKRGRLKRDTHQTKEEILIPELLTRTMLLTRETLTLDPLDRVNLLGTPVYFVMALIRISNVPPRTSVLRKNFKLSKSVARANSAAIQVIGWQIVISNHGLGARSATPLLT
jgi:hypothetical protein